MIATRTSTGLNRERNAAAIGTTPDCPEFAVVGPDFDLPPTMRQDDEKCVDRIGGMFPVFVEPGEDFLPKIRFIRNRTNFYPERSNGSTKQRSLKGIIQVKACFA